jgi:hypothetical protein
MGCTDNCGKKILAFLMSLIQVGCGVAIVIILYQKLSDFKFDLSNILDDPDALFTVDSCLLGNAVNNVDLCVYMYVVVAASFLVSILVSVLQCCTCNLCGCGAFLDFIVSLVGTVWWCAAAIVVTIYGLDANEAGWPQQNWRNAIIALAWVASAAFIVHLCLFLSYMCCCGDEEKEKYRNRD